MLNVNTNATTSSNSTSSVFPQTRLCLAVQESLRNMAPFQVKSMEQDLIDNSGKMKISIEAETPTDGDKSVGVRGTFTVPNDLDGIVTAQWEGAINILKELNEVLNCKRLSWERNAGYEPRHFEIESNEAINAGLKVITKAELSELGISTGKYKFRFEVKTVRCGSTLTSLEVEGFAHTHMH